MPTLPLAVHTITLTVNDGHGGSGTDMVVVTVRDTTPPMIAASANMTVPATSPAAVVNYLTPTVTDNVGVAGVVCTPTAGSTFPIGTTTVTCIATDTSGNTATASFQVVVLGAAAQTAMLINLVQSYNLNQGIANSLIAKLQGVQNALRTVRPNSVTTACNQLSAFINEAQAQSGKAITATQASELIAAANRIKAVLGCA